MRRAAGRRRGGGAGRRGRPRRPPWRADHPGKPQPSSPAGPVAGGQRRGGERREPAHAHVPAAASRRRRQLAARAAGLGVSVGRPTSSRPDRAPRSARPAHAAARRSTPTGSAPGAHAGGRQGGVRSGEASGVGAVTRRGPAVVRARLDGAVAVAGRAGQWPQWVPGCVAAARRRPGARPPAAPSRARSAAWATSAGRIGSTWVVPSATTVTTAAGATPSRRPTSRA